MRNLPLQPYHGNRFNILSENAAHVFLLKDEMCRFLEGHQANRLLQAVLQDLKTPQYLAGCKALGLISQLVTIPLWCLSEDKTIGIFEMNLHDQELVSFLDAATSDPRSFMTGQLHPFKSVASGVELDALLETWQHDHMVETILRVCLPAMAKLCRKLFADYLPTGRFGNPSHAASDSVKNMPKHNKFSETIFGVLDQLLRAKPNVSTLAAEAYIMFSHNNTLAYG